LYEYNETASLRRGEEELGAVPFLFTPNIFEKGGGVFIFLVFELFLFAALFRHENS